MLAAGGRGGADGPISTTRSRRALAELFRAYWFPLYAFVRRRGYEHAAAEDLVQEFFARLLERNSLATADRSRGRFRSFLLGAVKHFLSNQRARARAQKRGGGRTVIPLDGPDGETRYACEPVDDMTPERLFDRQWALAVLDEVLRRLAAEYGQAGKESLFRAVEPCLTGGTKAIDYRAVAEELAMTRPAVRTAVHRLRRRYRALLQDEIAQTVDSPDEIEEEVTYLLNSL